MFEYILGASLLAISFALVFLIAKFVRGDYPQLSDKSELERARAAKADPLYYLRRKLGQIT